jgi:hypothetical protein
VGYVLNHRLSFIFVGTEKLTLKDKDEIQQECPYWFQLRDLHGERPSLNVTEAAVRNSASSPKLEGLRMTLRNSKQAKKTVAAVEESDDSDASEDESHSDESDEEVGSSFEEEDNNPPAAKKAKVSSTGSSSTNKAKRRSITESELDEYCDGRRELSPLDISVPDSEPVAAKQKSVNSTKMKPSTTSTPTPSAPVRRGKDTDGIFEIWKNATTVKHEVMQSRKRKRDESRAAESIERMRRDADRADRDAAAAIAHQKQANALTWIEKRMEIARMTGDTDGLAEYAEQYEKLFSI